MSSSSRPPRSRYRFGFRGKRPGRNTQAATTDEILESLTRQAGLMEEHREKRALGLQTILETEPSEEVLQPSPLELGTIRKRMKIRSIGGFVFAAMLIGGLTFLWVYSRLSRTLNLQSVASLQQTISRAGFADWQKVALIALSAFTIALMARRSRNKARLRYGKSVDFST